MMRTQWSLSSILAAALVATLAACETTPVGPSAAAGEPVTEVVAHEVFAGMGPASTRMLSLNLSQRGTLELTATWQDPENSVVVFLTGAGCRSLDRLGSSECRMSSPQDHGTRQGQETAAYRGAVGEYRLWVVNHGPRGDTVAVTARLTYQQGDTSGPREPRRPHDPAIP